MTSTAMFVVLPSRLVDAEEFVSGFAEGQPLACCLGIKITRRQTMLDRINAVVEQLAGWTRLNGL